MSPKGVPPNPVLFPTITPTLEQSGFTINKEIFYADMVMIDLHTRIADYDKQELDWVLNSRVPLTLYDEFDRGGLSTEQYPYPLTAQQQKIFDHIERHTIPNVQFCRLLDKTKEYPSYLYPFEKCYAYEEPLLDSDQLFDRPYDVCLIANTSPQREAIAAALRSDKRLKCIIKLGEPKIPFNEWVDLHRQAKFFVSASAGGYSNERIQNLFSIAALIQERTNQLLLHPFSHAMNCLKVNQPPTQLDLQTIVDVCNDKHRLFAIYQNGYKFVKEFYSAEYIASDILKKIIKHIYA